MYKYSINGITIRELPEGKALFDHILEITDGTKIRQFELTSFEIRAGVTKRLIVHVKRDAPIYVWVGKNLKLEDLFAKYDEFGDLIVNLEEIKLIDDKRIIAEFMGWNLWKESGRRMVMEKQGEQSVFLDTMKFDTSWDDLIPVCSKIIHMYNDNRQDIFAGLKECNIESTFKAVVEFIKFWNNPEEPKLILNDSPSYDPTPAGRLEYISTKTKK